MKVVKQLSATIVVMLSSIMVLAIGVLTIIHTSQTHAQSNDTLNTRLASKAINNSLLSNLNRSELSRVKTSLSDAAKRAEFMVPTNNPGKAISARLEIEDGHLLYSIVAVDPTFRFYNIIIDAESGKVLSSSQLLVNSSTSPGITVHK
jgi:uncharacterized membrane protein YkoI